MQNNGCPHQIVKKPSTFTIKINCRSCTKGNASIAHTTCRKNIISLLQQKPQTQKLILNHALIQVFQGESLQILKELASFADDITMAQTIKTKNPTIKQNKKTQETQPNYYNELFSTQESDPYQQSINLTQWLKNNSLQNQKEKEEIQKLLHKATFLKRIPTELPTKETFYIQYIRPYIRPGFIDSFIQLNPPAEAVFYDSYTINKENNQPSTVTIYTMKHRPEKMYFIVPTEYQLSKQHLLLLEKIRQRLSHHRPEDSSFINQENTREYFKRFAKKTIAQIIKETSITLNSKEINQLATIFAKYTAGLGILEDVLEDNQIQDIYVNAPVTNNPLHLVINGEEHTSNVFLSPDDIEALSSRFRAESGRAFSEAAPVLDMDLHQFHTRVAAISNPLTPKGIAFALRRHRQKPWTLPQFIVNKMISAEAAGLLSFLVDGQASILIAGSRGAGKTSLLSALLLEIPQRYRILTIEDTAEIPVETLQQQGYKIQSLLTRSISSGSLSTEMQPTDALRTALRLGESVLILGEVRGVEAKVLFEAMRVGAAGNLIMGTIHGATTQDVYERIVYDIGVPPTSFKAVDAVAIAAPIRVEGGLDRKRRLLQISEITKSDWQQTPSSEKVFNDLMSYDSSQDNICSTDLFSMGQSELIQHIAKKWNISIEKAIQNIHLRANIKKKIAEAGKKQPILLEAESVTDANNQFWQFLEISKVKHGTVHYDFVKKQWDDWFQEYMGRKT
ncbi:MAG: type II/IV secretion system ATPase subunit [Thermoplasmatota archaeon]